jgi:glycosyltransferase involved in cell wall biosynthesis
MRLLAICESPPTTDPKYGNGSTLISAAILRRLPEDVELDLAWFTDRPVDPPRELIDRCRRRVMLMPRRDLMGLAALPFTGLPRATWQRTGAAVDEVLDLLQRDVDAAYLHGLHTFALAPRIKVPFAVHEVDPWSRYWMERARTRTPVMAAYDRLQARRAERLERETAKLARSYIVVSPTDAAELSADFGTEVIGIPNGIDEHLLTIDAVGEPEPRLIGFVGSLDYPPNQHAVHLLARDVFPRVAAKVPGARLLIAGRRPPPDVRALAGNGITVMADVPDIRDIYERCTVLAYPGELGRGAKNTVLEAMAMGRTVIASPSAARGIERGEHIVIASSVHDMAECIEALLDDPDRRDAIAARARAYARNRPTWDDVAREYAGVIGHLAPCPSPG